MEIHRPEKAKTKKTESFSLTLLFQKPLKNKPKSINRMILHIGALLVIAGILCAIAKYAVSDAASKHKYLISGLDYLYGCFSLSSEIDYEWFAYDMDYSYGCPSLSSEIDYESFAYKNIKTRDGDLEVTELPTMISAINRNTVILEYSDKMGRTYPYKARAVLVLNKLVLCPWCFERNIQADMHRGFEIFDVDYRDGDLVISRNRQSITLNSKSKTYNFVHVEGTACSEEDCYYGIQSLNIKYDPYYDLQYECEIQFTDGSIAKDAVVESVDIEENTITLSWSVLISNSNGDKYEHYSEGKITINYVDTYPKGFIILDYKKMYRYQKPFEVRE